MPAAWAWLLAAIVAETVGTSALQASRQFTRLGPTAIVLLGYGLSFWCMAMALRTMPVGVVYAIWSGLGIVLIAVIGWTVFGQRLDAPALVGMGLILGGVLVIHLFSNTSPR